MAGRSRVSQRKRAASTARGQSSPGLYHWNVPYGDGSVVISHGSHDFRNGCTVPQADETRYQEKRPKRDTGEGGHRRGGKDILMEDAPVSPRGLLCPRAIETLRRYLVHCPLCSGATGPDSDLRRFGQGISSRGGSNGAIWSVPNRHTPDHNVCQRYPSTNGPVPGICSRTRPSPPHRALSWRSSRSRRTRGRPRRGDPTASKPGAWA